MYFFSQSTTLEAKEVLASFSHTMLHNHLNQGCQIFLGPKYQNGEQYTKLPQNIPNGP
jgi:hypothetical protein